MLRACPARLGDGVQLLRQQFMDDVVRIAGRGDCHDGICLRYATGRCRHGRAAQAVADEELGRREVLAQVIGARISQLRGNV